MRFDFPYSIPKQKIECDVLLVSNLGMEFSGDSARAKALGGSEFEAVLLLEYLASRGLNCVCVNPLSAANRSYGVTYYPLQELIEKQLFEIHCETLINMRFGQIPPGVFFNRALYWLTDLIDQRHETVNQYMQTFENSEAVFVSEWHSKQSSPHWRSRFIHNMVPDFVYNERKAKLGGRRKFVYASAAMKGIEPTLKLWKALWNESEHMRKASLVVLSPGYDRIDSAIVEDGKKHGVEFVGPVPFINVIGHIKDSDGLFYCNAMPETFGIVAALAEAMRLPAIVLAGGHDGCGLKEVISAKTLFTDPNEFVKAVTARDLPVVDQPHDFSVSKIGEQWFKLIKGEK